MENLDLILFVAAFICFVLHSLNLASGRLIGIGLACWVLTNIV